MTAKHFIGPYGPFKLDSFFAFSDFASWGKGHNNGFIKCIDECRNKLCVIDIGAHVGLVCMPASKVIHEDGIVYAFEPATANLMYLRKHIKMNNINNIRVVSSLVGSVDNDNAVFFECSNPSGMNTSVNNDESSEYSKTSRNQIKLDTFCETESISPDIIKIDVEGFEYEVLSGAEKIISKAKPLIFLSMHPKQLLQLGCSVEKVSTLIEQLNYKCTEVDGSEVSEFRLAEYILSPQV
jgi:FkbM family methyltransferase